MINVEDVVNKNLPGLNNKSWLEKPVKAVLKNLLHIDEFEAFAQQYPHVNGLEFVEQVLQHFAVSYSVRDSERENIPASGKAVIIANHPIGSLDGLALIKLVCDIRRDVKVVVNSLLMELKPLQPLLLPVNNMGGTTPKENLKAIQQHLLNENAVIVFPAGEVSRLRPQGIRDSKWHSGFLKFASFSKAPIIPIFINAKNSATFYGVSMVSKPVSTLMLVGEMFKQQQKNIPMRIGKQIPFENYGDLALDIKTKTKMFKRHLYHLKKDKAEIFKTQRAIAPVEDRKQLKHAIQQCQCLGETPDGKKIYLHNVVQNDIIMREIGCLREYSFRAVGEGSGLRRDLDQFDQYYFHLILWDNDNLDIVGAYRLADTQAIIEKYGINKLYTHSLFKLDGEMSTFLPQSLELGRSFVQPKYWGKRSLDYLWYGIGAFIKKHPKYRYLFGPVSISNSLPQAAKDLLVYFYRLYFSSDTNFAPSRNPLILNEDLLSELNQQFVGNDYKKDFTHLKHLLANMGTSIPTLYKQYTELTEVGGVQFIDFGIDANFENCIDGLVIVDIHKIKSKKKQRYLA